MTNSGRKVRVWITRHPSAESFRPHLVSHMNISELHSVTSDLAALLVTAGCAVPELRSTHDVETFLHKRA